jgi:hypothetical protein
MNKGDVRKDGGRRRCTYKGWLEACFCPNANTSTFTSSAVRTQNTIIIHVNQVVWYLFMEPRFSNDANICTDTRSGETQLVEFR